MENFYHVIMRNDRISLIYHKLSVLAVILLFVLSACAGSEENSVDASLPSDFASLPDTAKVRVLLDQGVSADSLAAFVCESLNGKHGNVSFSDFDGIEIYVGERMGDEAAGMYGMSFEMYMQYLPLDKRYKVKIAMPLTDIETLGYTLGLEYVNQVIDNQMTIGQVDREVAALRRVCASDEDTFEHFLKGFATGIQISTSAAREVPSAIVTKYGSASYKSTI